MVRHGGFRSASPILYCVTWRSHLCQTRFSQLQNEDTAPHPAIECGYWGPKGTPGVLYTMVFPQGGSLQHPISPCLLLLGDDMDVRELSAVPGISTETLERQCLLKGIPSILDL